MKNGTYFDEANKGSQTKALNENRSISTVDSQGPKKYEGGS